MKTYNIIITLLLLLTTAGCTFAQPIVFPVKPWAATITIVGEDGQPISDADVTVAYTKPPYAYSDDETYHGMISGKTDVKGLFSATHIDRTGSLGFSVNKQGYYETRSSCTLRDPMENAGDRNISVTLLLKKIGKPIAMYAKKEETKIPKEDEPIGFDLMAGDWVAPNGAGRATDVLFTAHRKIVSPKEFDADLELTFPNVGDGIVVVPPATDAGSPLKMPHSAVETGYQSALTWSYHNFTETCEPASGYFVRVRTVLDANGNVKSALYGKIQGDIRFMVGSKAPRAGIAFDYYLNPTPNDRNVEFDPKQNLLGNLPFDEQVQSP